jgi:hypothetical protein
MVFPSSSSGGPCTSEELLPPVSIKDIEDIKVLTLNQPYASLVVRGIKDVENRTFKPNLRNGKLKICPSL